ncbi:MAG TPA: FAD-dependent oxidoreductase [Microthrixaceae bacterium]|nr:FAD-dependent oxidoreductase [Microthrixaceae bacterium]
MRFDAIVVGAGPAGSAAAIALARAGKSVALLERGPFPGSKNMYGGVIYGRILDGIIPNWWDEAPIQRWVTRRATMMMTPTQAMTIDYRTTTWGEAPYNGATAYRPDFDNWLAGHAVAAGAELICSTTATGLLREGTRVVGVRTDRPDGDLTADVVIACDGVNSFLAKEAGLFSHIEPEHYTVGVKETISLGKDTIDERFGLRGLEGADFEMIGCTEGIPGGGFLYTNLDTVAVGVVLQVTALGAQSKRPEEIIAGVKAHPSIAPLLEGGEVKEYSAHLIPEGGFNMMPELSCDGMLVAGDAAAMCLAAGIWLEGVNFAIGSGIAAGQAAVDALRRGDTSDAGLAGYRQRMETNFVLADHRKLRGVADLIMSERVQSIYPQLACNVAERIFTVENPRPKPGFNAIVRSEIKAAGVKLRDLAKDGITGLKGYG